MKTYKHNSQEKKCPECDGFGWELGDNDAPGSSPSDYGPCPKCKGTGKIKKKETE